MFLTSIVLFPAHHDRHRRSLSKYPVRISVRSSGQFVAEVMRDFRSWLINNSPILGKSPEYIPDDGGLNIEAVEWNPADDPRS